MVGSAVFDQAFIIHPCRLLQFLTRTEHLARGPLDCTRVLILRLSNQGRGIAVIDDAVDSGTMKHTVRAGSGSASKQTSCSVGTGEDPFMESTEPSARHERFDFFLGENNPRMTCRASLSTMVLSVFPTYMKHRMWLDPSEVGVGAFGNQSCRARFVRGLPRHRETRVPWRVSFLSIFQARRFQQRC